MSRNTVDPMTPLPGLSSASWTPTRWPRFWIASLNVKRVITMRFGILDGQPRRWMRSLGSRGYPRTCP